MVCDKGRIDLSPIETWLDTTKAIQTWIVTYHSNQHVKQSPNLRGIEQQALIFSPKSMDQAESQLILLCICGQLLGPVGDG